MSPESDSISQAVAQALEDLVGLSESERVAALPLVLGARLAHASNGASSATSQPSGAPEPLTTTQSATGQSVSAIANWLQLDVDTLETVFADAGEGIEVTVSSRRLANNNAAATRQLAQLVFAARQGTGLEEWTSFASVKDVVAEYGKHDSKNFSSHLNSLDEVATVSGKGANRKFKATKSGREQISDLVRSLSGNEGS